MRTEIPKLVKEAPSVVPKGPSLVTLRHPILLSAFDDVTVEDITKIVSSAPAKHCGLDPIPTWLLKRLLPLLSTTLTLICNTSFHQGVFPANLKDAIVYPRLKKSTLNPDEMNSFRPICNLSFLSKVVEHVVTVGLSAHFQSQYLLSSRQSAYRAHHSTETAIIAVHDETVRAIEAGDVCALMLLDLSAAFDTVDPATCSQLPFWSR